MTVPGIGALSSLMLRQHSLKTPADFLDLERWVRTSVLTPRRYQSGEIDRRRDASPGAATVSPLTLMYEAAIVILHRVKRPLHLKDWGRSHRAALRPRQGACSLGAQAVRDPAQCFGDPANRFRWAPQAREA